MKTVVAAGAFDTKGADYEFLVERLRDSRCSTSSPSISESWAIRLFFPMSRMPKWRARAERISSALRQSKDKTLAMRAMAEGLPRVLSRLREEGRLDGVCGMGGSGGTTILAAGMRALPIGVPKLLISTVAAGDVSAYVGSADVTMMHSVVDVAGVNRISLQIYTNAAAAIAGMVQAVRPESAAGKAARRGFDVRQHDGLHRSRARHRWTAPGGRFWSFTPPEPAARTMQRLASEGLLAGLLDLTTTELADEVCGGVFSAGPERVNIGGRSRDPGGAGARLRRHVQFRFAALRSREDTGRGCSMNGMRM